MPDITHFVAGLGTSGTLMGVGRYLKEHKPSVKVYAVEPPAGEHVEGLRSLDDGYVPPVFDKWGGMELLDGKRIVRPVESLTWTRRLLTEAGIFAGISSGAALAGAVKVAERIDEGVIVFVVSDGGWKYLSTGAYTEPIEDVCSDAGPHRLLLRAGTGRPGPLRPWRSAAAGGARTSPGRRGGRRAPSPACRCAGPGTSAASARG